MRFVVVMMRLLGRVVVRVSFDRGYRLTLPLADDNRHFTTVGIAPGTTYTGRHAAAYERENNHCEIKNCCMNLFQPMQKR